MFRTQSPFLFIGLLVISACSTAGGETSLIRAVRDGNGSKIVALLNHGVDVNARDNDGSTALMIAAAVAKPDIVRTLLDRGADANIKNRRGHTALMSAADSGQAKNAETLLMSMRFRATMQKRSMLMGCNSKWARDESEHTDSGI
jgi:FOG: Ankyrin repeat